MRVAITSKILGVSLLILAFVYVNCGHPASNAPSNTNSQDLPLLDSTVSSCEAVSSPCATVDFSQNGHAISPLLFGDGIEWANYGQDVLKPDFTLASPGTFRSDIMAALKDVGFTIMRYPGGTLSDLFHWNQSIGPVSSRIKQRTLNLDSNTNQLLTDVPYFGPDEFSNFAKQLGVDILVTVNVATGTSQEAAQWISYWKSKGVNVKYVEVGNENYISGPYGSFAAMAPLTYAQKFNEYAQAIRAVAPQVLIGAIGTMETSSWCYPNCSTHPWNEIVLGNITQKADFFAIHNNYAPGTSSDSQSIYEAMLAYPKFVRLDNSLIENDIQMFASTQNKSTKLAVTEFASYFLAPDGSSDLTAIRNSVIRNQNLASALFGALSYHTFISDPHFLLANHINPLHNLWQAPINTAAPDLSNFPNSYPLNYQPKPLLSAFGSVFKAYKETAGQKYVGVVLKNVPTMNTTAISVMPAQTQVPLLDAAAALGASSSQTTKSWAFLVNRSLTTDITTSLVLKNIPAGASAIVIDQLTADSYLTRNQPETGTQTIQFTKVKSARLPGTGTVGFAIVIPKFSLIRVRLQ